MQIQHLDIFDLPAWNDSNVEKASSFLQTPFWAEFKASHGWRPFYFAMENIDSYTREYPGADEPMGTQKPAGMSAGKGAGKLLIVLMRRFSRLASIAYVPMGPDISCTDPEHQAILLGELSVLLEPFLPRNTLFIRYDPPWGTEVSNISSAEPSENNDGKEKPAPILSSFPFIPGKPARTAPVHIQPPDTVLLDLNKSLDTLLAEMKSKWRYNIRLAEKKGVAIRFLEGVQGASEGIDIFYNLYLETAQRDGIAIHSKGYYSGLFEHALAWKCLHIGDKPVSARVYIAEHETSILASIITLFCGEEALYLYGASSNEKRSLMPAYSLQWQAIRDAKDAGCTRYDFYGIPPTDDTTHPMYGLYRFKTGFGGSILHRVGSLDIPLRPAAYALYRLFEAGRGFWFKKIVKLFRRETPQKS